MNVNWKNVFGLSRFHFQSKFFIFEWHWTATFLLFNVQLDYIVHLVERLRNERGDKRIFTSRLILSYLQQPLPQKPSLTSLPRYRCRQQHLSIDFFKLDHYGKLFRWFSFFPSILCNKIVELHIVIKYTFYTQAAEYLKHILPILYEDF